MKTLASVLFISALGVASLSAQQVQQPQQHSHLKVGDAAPDFELGGTNNFKFKLSDYKGKKNVVVAFFPAAFTAGCTEELTSYTKQGNKFTEQNTLVVGVSTDFIASLNYWAKNVLSTEVPLLSDHDRKIVELYGVHNKAAGIANRTSFVIGMDGKIADIYENREAIDISGALAACSRLAKH
jgi:peroxiredoxin